MDTAREGFVPIKRNWRLLFPEISGCGEFFFLAAREEYFLLSTNHPSIATFR